MNEVEIPFADIEHIELSRKPLKKDKMSKSISPLGDFESHNVIIHLKKENELAGIYGMKKQFKVLGLHIDEPKNFKTQMEDALNKNI